MNQPPAAHGFARIQPLVMDGRTIARFDLVNGSDYARMLPFYKAVLGANVRLWFDGTEPTATLTCIDADLTEKCTTDALSVLSEPGGTRYGLVGMTLTKHGLTAVESLHMRLNGDLGADASGVYSGNADWVGYNTSWGNGLLIWFR